MQRYDTDRGAPAVKIPERTSRALRGSQTLHNVSSEAHTQTIRDCCKSQQSGQSYLQDCPDFAERMKCKALRVRSEGSMPPYVIEVNSVLNVFGGRRV